MKKTLLACVFVLALSAVCFSAEELKGKKATLTGELKCAKCALKEGDKCQTVLQVDFGAADKRSIVNYYLTENDVAKEFHPKICHETKKTKVRGVIGQRISKDNYPFTATKIEELR